MLYNNLKLFKQVKRNCHKYNMEKIIFNRFVVLEKIGKGGNADIYLLYDMKNREFKALKVDENLDSIVEEFDCIKKSTNDYTYSIVTLNHSGEEVYGIIMDLFGYSLYDFLSIYFLEEHEFNVIIDMFKTEIDKLHNKGYVHLDIKPENIMITNIGHYKLSHKKRYVKFVHENHGYKCTKEIGLKIFRQFKSKCKKKTDALETEIDVSSIKMSLIDFGNIQKITEKNSNRTVDKCYTTCYYISPVYIFHRKQNTDCDRWAYACSLFELLFEKPLFNLCSENSYEEDIEELENKMIEMSVGVEEFISNRIQESIDMDEMHNEETPQNTIDMVKKQINDIASDILEKYLVTK